MRIPNPDPGELWTDINTQLTSGVPIDHTSIIATVHKRFGTRALTARDAQGEVAKQAIERAVLEHQYDDVLMRCNCATERRDQRRRISPKVFDPRWR